MTGADFRLSPICRNCGEEGHEAFGCEGKKVSGPKGFLEPRIVTEVLPGYTYPPRRRQASGRRLG
jgi:hypothetical protein